jgi:NAD-dependent deacetylase
MTPADLAKHLHEARRAVALTGAGISTAAGVPDFRGPEGIYSTGKYDPERTFDIGHFLRDPKPFFDFTRDMLGMVGEIEPTFTHGFLAKLEELGKLRAVVTQNIDPLHQEAGSREVICVHGSFHTSRCLACGREYGFEELVAEVRKNDVPHCSCDRVGVIKPDVVLFGEMVKGLDRAADLIAACDVLLVLGSSLTVHPAAGLPRLCRGLVVVVNKGGLDSPGAPNWQVVDAELDPFFREVAEAMDLSF